MDERINPSGGKKLFEAFQRGDLEVVKEEARIQVSAGPDVLDVINLAFLSFGVVAGVTFPVVHAARV